MQITLDTKKELDTVKLGDVTLPVADYQIKTEVPIVRRTFCDGTHSITLLADLPCTFTFSGTLLRQDASCIVAALQTDMQAHTPFSFDFAGFSFSDMQIVSAECQVKEAAHTAAFTISMTGVYVN